jgi:hypothetical protein
MDNVVLRQTLNIRLMGRARKARKSQDELFISLSKMIVPEFVLENFEVSNIKELTNEWVVELEEKQDKIPLSLSEYQDVVMDGFCHSIDVLSHSFSLKPVILRVYRRRWKRSGTDKHYSNTYELTIKGLKMVPGLGLFLKEEDRRISG